MAKKKKWWKGWVFTQISKGPNYDAESGKLEDPSFYGGKKKIVQKYIDDLSKN